MNFQQLRYVRAAVQNDLNLTKVANELFTSQSGLSKQIRALEAELRLEILLTAGNSPAARGSRARSNAPD